MKLLITSLLALLTISSANVLRLRHKRQLEVEGDTSNDYIPSNEVVVIKDVNNDNGPTYQLIPLDPNTGMVVGGEEDTDIGSMAPRGGNTDVVDLDINEDDGTFRLGGRLPSLHDHFHRTNFAEMFRAIQERFDEMARRMAASFGNTGMDGVHIHTPCCGHGGNTDDVETSGSSQGEVESSPTDLQVNRNETKTEIINIHGQRFLKKTTVIRKGGPGTSIFISSTTYEPINDSENTDGGNEESKPSGPDGSDNYPSGRAVPSSSTQAPSSSTEATSSPSSTTEASVPKQPEPESGSSYDEGAVASGSSTSSTDNEKERATR